MQKIVTSFSQTGRFSKIITDYLNNNESLSSYISCQPDISGFRQVIESKKTDFINRNELVDVLKNQYQNLTVSPLVNKNIEAFANENTFCIVTAHQLNIFTGPLYVIYKTVSAIKLCQTLTSQYPDFNFVPVFWLGSEDHDFEEINHVSLFGKTYTWEDKQGGACGHYSTNSIQQICEQIFAVMGNSPEAEYLKNIFTDAYLKENDLTQATRIILNHLFESYGLVIVDGDDAILKANCSTIIQDELFNQSAEKIVQSVLQDFPYEAQAKPRNINLFYLQPHLRERIIYEGENKFSVNNTNIVFTAETLKEEVLKHPENFSPNVILRPLFQQKVLPSLAYIGGGGEIAYWLQLKSLFEYHHIQFPMLLLRDSFLMIDEAAQKKIDKLELSVESLFQDEQQLLAHFVKTRGSDQIELTTEKQVIDTLFATMMQKAQSIDTSLDKAVLAEKQAVIVALSKLEAKLLKAEKAKMEVELNQIKGLLNKLFPEGGLQERSENFIPHYLKHGSAFIETLIANAEQPVSGFTILLLNRN